MEPCMKVLGADFELANSLADSNAWDGGVREAARRLLDEIAGYPEYRYGGTAIEWGRRFLSTCGGSAYIDSDHLEINLPEHTQAVDHAALMHAGFRIARAAQVAAERKDPHRGRINVLTAVSDRQQSWGHHLNVLMTRPGFEGLLFRRPHLAGFLATHLATATVYTGHGQVGAGNQRAACDYQLSQRADWFEEFAGLQTMHRRPLLNLRDEPHAGPGLARLHLIYFDNVLCPVANFLKAGTTQLVLALIEAGWADPGLLLDDPLAAALEVSRDLSLRQPLAMAQRGRTRTAVEVQQEILDQAREFVAAGKATACVPGAEAILTCWEETLTLLAERDLAALARRCDWALKYLLLDRQRGRRALTWTSAPMKHLDLIFSSLDPEEGLFWQMAAAGQVADLPSSDRIDRFYREPPEDTRAYLRAHVLRRFGHDVVDMDWDRMRFRMPAARYWYAEATLPMPDPVGLSKSTVDGIFGGCRGLPELLEAIRDGTTAANGQGPMLRNETCAENREGPKGSLAPASRTFQDLNDSAPRAP